MTDVLQAEQEFVELFIRREKRERYLSLLKGQENRKKILETLNHALDYVPEYASKLDSSLNELEALTVFLLGRGAKETSCHLMADGHVSDGQSLRLTDAVDAFLNNYWGSLIICGTPTIAVYRPESPSGLIFLSR